jgi:hypothetical protein
VLGIGMDQLELPFQQMPDWPPIDAGGLHGHVSTVVQGQPLATLSTTRPPVVVAKRRVS